MATRARGHGQLQPHAGETLIALEGVEKVYRLGRVDYPALRSVDLTVAAGEMVAVVGPSGSGKTPILNMVTGIDQPTKGAVTVDGRRLDEMSEEELPVWRGANVGKATACSRVRCHSGMRGAGRGAGSAGCA